MRRLWDAWQRDDLTAWLDLISDDLVTRRVGLDNATYHGKEGFLEQASEWSEGFAEWSVAAQEFIDAGDQVVVRNHQSGRGDASGAPIEMDSWFVHTVNEGKVVQVDMYVDEREALEAARLSE
ncbi:MAG: nuclear transport factor 2 family protein [Actinomycetota bacterium]